jgi:hypothetical protein
MLTSRGVGAIAYVEYARRLFPDRGESDREINNLTAAMRPGMTARIPVEPYFLTIPTVVYWLVLFSVIVHGLSVPILYVFYRVFKVPKVHDHPVEVLILSENEPLPNNSVVDPQRRSVLVHNRFSEPSGLNVDSDEEKEHDEQRESTERIRPRSERSSASHSLRMPLSHESTQRLSREVDARDIV